ncbi:MULTISPECIES: hypothetical protein [Geobacillus]|uniref:hypothetical protein n=1 Tax=Geobacillus TaxID=129337 RepID=UPI0004A362A5|nr:MULTISPECIES: hypothetical protein [Geobacillus]ARA99477.1 hypothetical protein GD3902_16450 [Geobacillus thermodenitrificans]MED3719207.1 hypothetical protein [Geobacillus thermodenitrificans]QNU31641.1 hypothetical protein IC804_02200 [Geobacillus sp. 47C-IIb]
MIKRLKKGIVALITAGALVFVLGNPNTYAASYTDFGPASFATEDGKYELTIRTTSVEKNVTIWVYDLYRVNRNSGAVTSMNGDTSPLSVRLCNASTGNCTAFKSFWEGNSSAIFTNMKAGTFYVDIRDSWANYYFKGKVAAKTYSWNPDDCWLDCN